MDIEIIFLLFIYYDVKKPYLSNPESYQYFKNTHFILTMNA